MSAPLSPKCIINVPASLAPRNGKIDSLAFERRLYWKTGLLQSPLDNCEVLRMLNSRCGSRDCHSRCEPILRHLVKVEQIEHKVAFFKENSIFYFYLQSVPKSI